MPIPGILAPAVSGKMTRKTGKEALNVLPNKLFGHLLALYASGNSICQWVAYSGLDHLGHRVVNGLR